MNAPLAEGNRNALLDLHFSECDARTAASTRDHLEGCAECRAYLAQLSAVEHMLLSWNEEEAPPELEGRVLERAVRARQAARAPAAATGAMPLLGLVPAMAAFLALMRALAGWLAQSTFWSSLGAWPDLQALAPFATAVVILFLLGGLGTLAVAPALVLESGERR